MGPILIFLSVLTIVVCSLTVDYYEELINQKTEETQGYKLPRRNEEFNKGFNSRVTNDFGFYDFVIVGAGSSGSVLATRLSEINNFTVLLLEAGGEEDDFNQIMALNNYLQFTDMNWGYYTTRQTKCCLGMKDQKCQMPRGKLIGGSSSTNGMMYVRGNSKDYDKWVRLGNPGWSYNEVLPYFKKSENSQIEGDAGYHEKGGFWNVEYSQPPSSLLSNFINASVEANLSILDYNGRSEFGVSEMQFNTKRGKRQSTGTAFLNNARKRKNLEVLTKALATKILIDPETKLAKQVEFVKGNEKFRVTAKKEIIISGGVFNTPQLLMLSGVGPKSHLEKLGIKVAADLPVGENLKDHPMFPALVFQTNHIIPTLTTKKLVEMYLNGEGPLTLGAGINGVGFLQAETETEVPTIEYLFVPPRGTPETILGRVYNYNKNLQDNFLQKIDPKRDIIILLALLHPKSKGRITLKSTNPIDFPEINLNMFDEQEDVNTMIEGIHFVIDLLKTKPFKAIDAQLLDYPICKEWKKDDHKFWDCIVRHMTVTIFHGCCTTPMGPDPATSVVDTNLKVHGIQHLRVVDAGVLPATISGHTNAPAIMIAEKISDVIKNDYGY